VQAAARDVTAKTRFNGSSDQLHVVERIRRVDANMLNDARG
jgi:hypothetical protein